MTVDLPDSPASTYDVPRTFGSNISVAENTIDPIFAGKLPAIGQFVINSSVNFSGTQYQTEHLILDWRNRTKPNC